MTDDTRQGIDARERDAPFRLHGQRAVVTGASRGIGAAIAAGLARAGADIVAIQRGADNAETRAAVEAWGQTYTPIPYDLSNTNGIPALVERIEQEQGAVDILVNAAGITARHLPEEFPQSEWDAVIAVNLTATWLTCQAFGRAMLGRSRGKIINVASLMSFQGGILVPAYAASKGAVASLTRALANDWAARGVNVNAIAPGYVATELTAKLKEDETRARQILERVPAGRWGRPEDVAGAVVFLASPAADFVHGEILVVDGGWMGR